ncbi:hypothetical protein [Streptomyces sp. 184]|uniref:hypothetical protein n=1 Tax=Streptomyces sp. 184 TaxID=1827526 RepID=UPI003891A73B
MGQGTIGFGPWAWEPDEVPRGEAVEPVPGDVIRAALQCALNGVYEDPFAAPEGAAVMHPNGFAKIPVALVPAPGQRLFLHAWFRDAEDSHIHNHRWNFASTVLTGTLHHTTVDVSLNGEGPGCRIALHRPVADGFTLVGVRGEGLRISGERTQVLPAGTEYVMQARTLHRVRAESGTMTLVARGQPFRGTSEVLLDRSAEDGRQRMRAVAADERERWLRAALRALG